jgi:hypothetical protein
MMSHTEAAKQALERIRLLVEGALEILNANGKIAEAIVPAYCTAAGSLAIRGLDGWEHVEIKLIVNEIGDHYSIRRADGRIRLMRSGYGNRRNHVLSPKTSAKDIAKKFLELLEEERQHRAAIAKKAAIDQARYNLRKDLASEFKIGTYDSMLSTCPDPDRVTIRVNLNKDDARRVLGLIQLLGLIKEEPDVPR